jgi:hypothetical protein
MALNDGPVKAVAFRELIEGSAMTRSHYRTIAIVLAAFLSVTTLVGRADAAIVNCIIASNDGDKGFRTDEVTRCRVDTDNGRTAFTFKGKKRDRSYKAKQALTKSHVAAASYWLKRADKLKFNPKRNPAGFDATSFLREAAKATSGFVLIHERKGKRAMNVVYITGGVYRSIDFPGTNPKAMPSGLLTTGRW